MQERFDFLELDESDERTPEDIQEYEDWKKKKKEAKARFTAMQNLPYEVKVRRAEQRAIEFIEEMDKRGCNAHVSVGGLDSITLLIFLRHIGI